MLMWRILLTSSRPGLDRHLKAGCESCRKVVTSESSHFFGLVCAAALSPCLAFVVPKRKSPGCWITSGNSNAESHHPRANFTLCREVAWSKGLLEMANCEGESSVEAHLQFLRVMQLEDTPSLDEYKDISKRTLTEALSSYSTICIQQENTIQFAGREGWEIIYTQAFEDKNCQAHELRLWTVFTVVRFVLVPGLGLGLARRGKFPDVCSS